MKFAVFLLMTVGLLSSCASKKMKDDSMMTSSEYQGRPQLTESLMTKSEPLSEAAIQKILKSKVALPKSIQLAIVRLADSSRGLDYQTLDQEQVDQFYDKAQWGDRVRSIVPVPQMMLAAPVNINSLRQSAVLLQADALVIVKPMTASDWKFRLFEDHTAKASTSLEVLLLDIRTGIVPFAGLITEKAEVKSEKADYSIQEMMDRAKKASENKALSQIPGEIKKFISKAL